MGNGIVPRASRKAGPRAGQKDERSRPEGASPPMQEAQPPSLAATLPDLELSLLELADRLLSKGVVLTGEATISVAGIDLIYLGLNLVLSSVETMREAGRRSPGDGPVSAGEDGHR